ncbi:MAG: adenylate/guanylate cyclase domain-containing protein [Gammaproteobacteria bacterium]|nr:adenylate/guanylate cyclase domain-containing protein [Gammaproteobacteria bacterium]
MRPFIQNAVSYFVERTEAHRSTSTDGPHDVIVSGYSCPLTNNQQELCQDSCDRRQVGILYADIADYSCLTEQDEEGTHHRLVESMKIIEVNVTANNGRVAHTAGDAILVEFKDIDSALHCAVNVQLAAREMNDRLPLNQRVLFRIGVNFGDVIADNGDIYGNAVNLAARLEELANRGGICVSESVRSELEGSSAFNFVALGKRYVKNFSEPVQAFWIEIDAQQVVDAGFTSSLKVSAMAS